MLFRITLPYFLLFIAAFIYIYYRHKKLGPVLKKVDRHFLTKHNLDSFFLIFIMAVLSFYLMNLESQNESVAEGFSAVTPSYQMIFYIVLLLVVIARELEKPAFREKGFSTPRGFWLWEEIVGYRWNNNVLSLSLASGKKRRTETWLIQAAEKQEEEQYLKKMEPKKTRPKKKK